MQKYIAQLNEAQRTRITKDGPMIIIAGAGSGKTRVWQYVSLIWWIRVDAFNILSLTFTNKREKWKSVFLIL
jgi:DNA helicase-2/ATP-dependent DNA helicase PcrA